MKIGNGSVYLATAKADKRWNLIALIFLNIWIKIKSGTYGGDDYTQLKKIGYTQLKKIGYTS
jgi:hypothetical protein